MFVVWWQGPGSQASPSLSAGADTVALHVGTCLSTAQCLLCLGRPWSIWNRALPLLGREWEAVPGPLCTSFLHCSVGRTHLLVGALCPQAAAASQQPTVGETPAGCQGLPECHHPGRDRWAAGPPPITGTWLPTLGQASSLSLVPHSPPHLPSWWPVWRSRLWRPLSCSTLTTPSPTS